MRTVTATLSHALHTFLLVEIAAHNIAIIVLSHILLVTIDPLLVHILDNLLKSSFLKFMTKTDFKLLLDKFAIDLGEVKTLRAAKMMLLLLKMIIKGFLQILKVPVYLMY